MQYCCEEIYRYCQHVFEALITVEVTQFKVLSEFKSFKKFTHHCRAY